MYYYHELDFEKIKLNIIDFMKQDDYFKDYNFDGSNINHLVNMFAYIVQYMSYYLNMSVSEAYMQTAQLEDNVLKLARHQNYVPKRKKSATLLVDFDDLYFFDLDGNNSAKFWVDENPLHLYDYFQVTTDSSLSLVFKKYLGEYSFVEGTIITKTIPYNTFSSGFGSWYKYELKDENDLQMSYKEISENSIQVKVGGKAWVYAGEDKIQTSTTDEFYFLEYIDGRAYVLFGNGSLGKIPTENIEIKYIKSQGADVNKYTVNRIYATVNSSKLQLAIGTTINNVVTATDISGTMYDGQVAEDIEEIRQMSSKFYSTGGRSVTEDDYAVNIEREMREIADVSVWGGEKECRNSDSKAVGDGGLVGYQPILCSSYEFPVINTYSDTGFVYVSGYGTLDFTNKENQYDGFYRDFTTAENTYFARRTDEQEDDEMIEIITFEYDTTPLYEDNKTFDFDSLHEYNLDYITMASKKLIFKEKAMMNIDFHFLNPVLYIVNDKFDINILENTENKTELYDTIKSEFYEWKVADDGFDKTYKFSKLLNFFENYDEIDYINSSKKTMVMYSNYDCDKYRTYDWQSKIIRFFNVVDFTYMNAIFTKRIYPEYNGGVRQPDGSRLFLGYIVLTDRKMPIYYKVDTVGETSYQRLYCEETVDESGYTTHSYLIGTFSNICDGKSEEALIECLATDDNFTSFTFNTLEGSLLEDFSVLKYMYFEV